LQLPVSYRQGHPVFQNICRHSFPVENIFIFGWLKVMIEISSISSLNP